MHFCTVPVPAAYNVGLTTYSMDALLIVSDLSYAGRVYFDIPMPVIYIFNRSIHPSWAYPLLPWLNFKGMINNQAIFYPFILNIQNFLQNPQTVKNLSNIFTLMCCF